MSHDVIIWDFKPSDGARIQITSCAWPSSKCTVSDSDYEVTRSDYSLSILTIKRNHRTKIAGTVRCGGAYGANLSFASCDVRVVCKSFTFWPCHVVSIHISDILWPQYAFTPNAPNASSCHANNPPHPLPPPNSTRLPILTPWHTDGNASLKDYRYIHFLGIT